MLIITLSTVGPANTVDKHDKIVANVWFINCTNSLCWSMVANKSQDRIRLEDHLAYDTIYTVLSFGWKGIVHGSLVWMEGNLWYWFRGNDTMDEIIPMLRIGVG